MSVDEPIVPVEADTEHAGDAELAEVLDGYLAAVEAGEAVDPQRLLEEHPAVASRLRVCLAGLGLVEQEGRALRGEPRKEDTAPRVLGDYRLLRQIGRGGMGVVYEAEQTSLGRRVALKVLPFAATLDPRQLQRFQAEAQAAAALQHPNIVPVYAVGCEQGVHYYAMQLIEGRTLAAVIENERRPQVPTPDSMPNGTATQRLRPNASTVASSAPSAATHSASASSVSADRIREFVRLGVQAAEALDHAHRFGIVHRDIKPGNLLLDDQGRLWVADFGLALFRPDQRLTQTGDLVGTLRYMSPEQARAQRGLVDHRTDVYALGATLYELLTLRPLWDGADTQTLLNQIALHDPVPPRRLNPAIGRDLEVILLKAVARNADERYATAQEFADDLNNFLEDRPIKARPPTVSQQFTRWAKRHRQLVTAVLVGMVLAVVGLTIATGLVWRALTEQTRTAGELREALGREQRNACLYCVRAAAAAWDENKTGLVEELLEECTPATRMWEWHYLKRQCHQDLRTFRGHTDMIHTLALSPDGSTLATGSLDRSVRLWNTSDGRTLRTLSDLPDVVHRVAFSPEGARLAVAFGVGELRIYRVADGELLSQLPRQGDRIFGLAWHPRKPWLALGAGTAVVVWDLDRGSPQRQFHLPEWRAGGVAFSPVAGRNLLVAANRDGGMRLWDLETGKELLNHNLGGVSDAVAFAPDGKRFALLHDNYVQLNSLIGRQERALQSPEGHRLSGVAFSPDGRRVAAASYDRTVHLWDAASGKLLRRYRGHADLVFDVTFSPDGLRIYSSSKDGTAKVWEVEKEPASLPLRGHEERVVGVAFSPDSSRLATAALDPAVRIWDAAAGKLRQSLRGHQGEVYTVAYLPDGVLASGGEDDTVILWDEEHGEPLQRFTLDGDVVHLAVRGEGRWFAASTRRSGDGFVDTEVQVWDVDRGERVARFPGKRRPGFSSLISFGSAFSPDGTLIATSEEGKSFPVYELATGRETFRCLGSGEYGGRMAFSPDGRFLAAAGATANFEIALWDAVPNASVRERRPIRILRGHTQPIQDVAFSPNGRRLVSVGRDGTVRLWDLEKGWEVLTLHGDEWAARGVAFSPDGHRLAAGTGNKLARIWDGTPWTVPFP